MSGVKDQGDLQERMRRFSGSLPQEASVEVELQLVRAFRTRRRRPRLLLAYWAGAACLALALTAFFRQNFPSPHQAAVAKATYAAATAGFVALPYAQSDVPLEETVIVRVTLQPDELGSLGAPMAAARTGNGLIKADLLVGQDGIARAFRLVE